MKEEGLIKFDCRFTSGPSPRWHKIRALAEWRQIMYKAGLIGRYHDGIGYGNISVRDDRPREFIITGSRTGAIKDLRPEHFTRITDFSLVENWVSCLGPIEASSETLTHAAFYSASRSINAVIHIHHQAMWAQYVGKLPTTRRDTPYGTPEMAFEVIHLLKKNPRPSKQLIIMGGHEEGVIAYGSSLGNAASILLNCCDALFR